MHKRLTLLIFLTIGNCSTKSDLTFKVIEGSPPLITELSIELDSLSNNQINYGDHFIFKNERFYAWIDPNFSIVRLHNFDKKNTTSQNLFKTRNNNLFLSQLNNPVVASFFIWNDKLVTFNKFNLGKSQVLELPTLKINDTLSIGNGKIFKGINYTSNSLVQNENILFFTIDPEINLNAPVNQDSLAWLQKVDLQTGESREISLPTPKEYKNKIVCPSGLIPATTIDRNNNLVISWPASLDLTIYNTSKDQISIIKLDPYLKLSNPLFEETQYADCNSLYQEAVQLEMIKYSPESNLYYIFYSKPSGLNGKTLGLLVLNSSFELTNSIDLKANTYNLNGVFVNEEGIAIPKTHPLNSNLDEDYIHFDLFTFD